jgi:hypothetical protein
MSGSSEIKGLDQIIVDGKEYNKVLFIHIPKTSGVSITKALDQTNLLNWKKDKLHNHKNFMTVRDTENIPEGTFKFSVVRDPFTRAYSYFKHFNKINTVSLSFNDFLNVVEGEKFYEKTPLVRFNQSHYIYDQWDINNLDKIYKFENLKEIEKDFGFKLPFENKGIYTADEYYQDYTSKLVNRVLDIYEKDFINFGYSTEFKK